MPIDTNHMIDLITGALDRDYDVQDYDIDGQGIVVYYEGPSFTITIVPR